MMARNPKHRIQPGRTMPREAPLVGRDGARIRAERLAGISRRGRQSARFQTTERQISPPSTQPAVVSVSPASVIVPE